ncbi:ATP-binding cassette domain-containing protein [Dyadobacter sp. CY312]|uniref:ATP-binding cassette domain-containing protein n=1 Tax=Dyadobacter sp. CY312 TaxID=2907303 RepID=UPI001F3EE6F5|nr:ATP-binding cassette domain-containing protein [Dyadobacter sp. CY312]MCE7043110.1 ATP-binding cassette domain-containing protein [Dyadobacter sp. CY312]
MKTQLLEADSMWLEYNGKKILQSIYIKMETGKVTGLLGRNGTGKSSLLRMIFGTLRGQNQSVRINGEYIAKPYLHAGIIRYLPQSNFMPKNLKVNHLCELYRVRFQDVTDHFPEFDKYEKHLLGKLSGGEIRLIETLLILLSPVHFVLLDEPFTHVSPLMVEKLSTVIHEQKENKGILLSDHAYQHVTDLSDDLYMIVPIGRSVLLKNPEQDIKSLGYTS